MTPGVASAPAGTFAGTTDRTALRHRLIGPGGARFVLPAIVLLLIFALAASLRLGWLAINSHSVSYAGIAGANGDTARNIVVHNRWFVINDVSPKTSRTILVDPASLDYRAADADPRYRQAILEPPGLPLVLAAIWEITGNQRFIYLQALQLLVDSAMVFLIYYVARRLFRRRLTGYVAALLYALYVPAMLVARIPNGDAWAGWITIGGLALVAKWHVDQHRTRWLVALGALMGVGAYFRPNLVLLPFAFCLALLPFLVRRDAGRLLLIPLACAAGLVAPWTVRNYRVFHTFVPVRTGFGWALWGGLGEQSNNFGATGDDTTTVRTVLSVHPTYPVGGPAFDSYLEHKALRAIAAHPFFYADLVGRRLLESTILPTPTGTARSSGAARFAAWAQPLLVGFAFIVGALMWRRGADRWGLALLAATAAATTLPYLLIHLEARYLVATACAYLVLAASGVTLIVDRVVERARARRADTRANLPAA